MTGEGPSEESDGTGVGPAPLPEATATRKPEVAPADTPQPTATATIDPQLLLPTRLRIPVMFLDSQVHEVTINLGEWEVSAMDIGHHEGTGNPGQPGNVVLAGHRDVNSALFRELDRLTPGDEVFVSNELGEYRYVVQDVFEVSPGDSWVMEPTSDKRVTLITCTPIGLATRRLIVVAVLDG
jgi:sortase A